MTSDPFLKAVKDESAGRKSAVTNLRKGMKLVTAAEVGMHLPPGHPFAKRRVFSKPDDSAEGRAIWEKQSFATHQQVEAEGGAILVLVMQGHGIGSESHRKRLQDWREGKLELPTLQEALGMKPVNNQVELKPRTELKEHDTPESIAARVARARASNEGVRLERAPHVIRLGR